MLYGELTKNFLQISPYIDLNLATEMYFNDPKFSDRHVRATQSRPRSENQSDQGLHSLPCQLRFFLDKFPYGMTALCKFYRYSKNLGCLKIPESFGS